MANNNIGFPALDIASWIQTTPLLKCAATAYVYEGVAQFDTLSVLGVGVEVSLTKGASINTDGPANGVYTATLVADVACTVNGVYTMQATATLSATESEDGQSFTVGVVVTDANKKVLYSTNGNQPVIRGSVFVGV